MYDLTIMGEAAKLASRSLSVSSDSLRNAALEAIARELKAHSKAILEANEKDVALAQDHGISSVMVDRLTLNDARIESMCIAAAEISAMADPLGVIDSGSIRPNGMRVVKTRVPLGVIGMIYESRPNVTVDAALLCLKSGNACILRGGKEAINSNIALTVAMQSALESVGLPKECVQLITDTTHDSSNALMRLNGYVDVLIPRGSERLISAVVQNATVPVIETGTGNCHVYVDQSADLEMAADIVFNAKTTRPSACNSAESLLLHSSIAEEFLPMVKERLDAKSVELRGCSKTLAILPSIKAATEEDFGSEYLDFIMSVKILDSVEEAVLHINNYGTHHSDAIVTESYTASEYFMKAVDSAAVYVNASTRFTDGGEFGMGAEMGISNQKLHARGPVGIRELTTTKFQVYGSGQIR